MGVPSVWGTPGDHRLLLLEDGSEDVEMAVGDGGYVQGVEAGLPQLECHFFDGVGAEQGAVVFFLQQLAFGGRIETDDGMGGGFCGGAHEVPKEHEGLGLGDAPDFAPELGGAGDVVEDAVGEDDVEGVIGEGQDFAVALHEGDGGRGVAGAEGVVAEAEHGERDVQGGDAPVRLVAGQAHGDVGGAGAHVEGGQHGAAGGQLDESLNKGLVDFREVGRGIGRGLFFEIHRFGFGQAFVELFHIPL